MSDQPRRGLHPAVAAVVGAAAAVAATLSVQKMTAPPGIPGPGTVLDGHGARAKDGLTLVGKSNLTLRGLTIKNWGRRGLFLANCRSITIDGCTLDGNGRNSGDSNGVAPALLAVNCDSIIVQNCTLRGSGGKQIYFAQSSDHCKVLNCLLDGQGVSLMGIQINAEDPARAGDPLHDQVSDGFEIANNIITNDREDGINLAIARNGRVVNNFIQNTGPLGISLWNDGIGGSAWGCRNDLIAFNTILNPNANRGALNFDGTGSGNQAVSNVLIGGLKVGNEQIVSANNLLSGDPKLGSNHRPLPGSPLIAAGKPVSGVSQDMTGKARPSKPSIGALEP